MARRGWLLIGPLVLAMTSGGCSIAFVTPPHKAVSAELPRPACTDHYLAPVLDTLWVGVEAVRLGVALDKSSADYQGAILPRSADLGLGALFLAVFTASAVYGYAAVSDCRDSYARFGRPAPTPRHIPISP